MRSSPDQTPRSDPQEAPHNGRQVTTPAPRGLAEPQWALWRAILVDFDPSPGELRLLSDALFLAMRADECAACRAMASTEDRYHGVKTHPSLDAEIRCRTSAAALLHKLGVKLPDDEPRPLRSGGKPGPRPKSQRQAAS